MAWPQPSTPIFFVSGPQFLLVERSCNGTFDDSIHNDTATVVQPDQMRCATPNHVTDYSVIAIAHPRSSRYGIPHFLGKFVGIGFAQVLPTWCPIETIEFDAR
jgi:hypothetical protein